MSNKKTFAAEEQSKLTPAKLIEILKQGNGKFANKNLTVNNSNENVHDAISWQRPEAVILSCMDSRVPVEYIFQRGIGDIFVVRVAGNIVNSDIVGSMEYACKEGGAKLVVVMGHRHCNAVKAAIDNIEFGSITELLSKIKPAINEAKVNFHGETKSSNETFVQAVCHDNVKLMVNEIRKESPILKEMEAKGEIQIVGAVYDLDSGKVEFFENL